MERRLGLYRERERETERKKEREREREDKLLTRGSSPGGVTGILG